VRGRRQAVVEYPLERCLRGEGADEAAQRVAYLARVAARHVGAEERLRDDDPRERHHLLVRVERLSVLPVPEHALGVRDHRARVRLDAVAVEGGLRESALATPELALARHQPAADEAS